VVAGEDRLREPPQGVAGESDREQDQEPLPERLLCDRTERALAVRALLPPTERDLHREDRDHGVQDPSATRPMRASRSTHGLWAARRHSSATVPELIVPVCPIRRSFKRDPVHDPFSER
jgi:hypothetical protein